jgi:hypothetical protein
MEVPKNINFVWDGSYLGVINDDNILNSCIYKNFVNNNNKFPEKVFVEDEKVDRNIMFTHIWKLKIGILSQLCYVRKINSSIPCFIDETKELFGLKKLGTHWCKYKNIKYILIRANNKINKIFENKLLIDFDIDYFSVEEKDTIRKIFMFRDIMGMKLNNEKSICIREMDEKMEILCAFDTDSKYELTDARSKLELPKNIKKKWFGDNYRVCDVAKSLCGYRKNIDINCIILNLNIKMTSIMRRLKIDKQHIISCCIKKIRTYLMT